MIGAGVIAAAHADAIAENRDCNLEVVCDIDISKAEKVAMIHNATIVTDYKKINNVDAVIINLPHYLHCEVSCYFLKKNVYYNIHIELFIKRAGLKPAPTTSVSSI